MIFKKKQLQESIEPELPKTEYYINAVASTCGSFCAYLVLSPELNEIVYFSQSYGKDKALEYAYSMLVDRFGQVSVKSDKPNFTQEQVSNKNEYIVLLKVICSYLCGYPLTISDKLLILRNKSIEGIPERLVDTCENDIESLRADY